jgi:hypothetical protein
VANPQPKYSYEQLRLFHNELDRQRDASARRLSNMHTRAAILVASSGVLGTIQSVTQATSWAYIPVLISLSAAILGVIAMRPTKGPDADARKNLDAVLKADPYSAEHYIVRQNQRGLEDDMRGLDSLRKVILCGYSLLVFSWIAMLAVIALHATKVI